MEQRYIDNIKQTTPSGMFTERNINGLWVSADGVVYKDFDKEVHYVTEDDLDGINLVRHFAGVDWGYEHHGIIVVIGEDAQGNQYLIEEHAHQHLDIDAWVEIAKGIKARYGNIPFYCDSARPEHVDRFEDEGLLALYADKSILSGIEQVGKRFKAETLYIVRCRVDRFPKEIYNYVWNEQSGLPLKVHDDVMDAIRYAIYTDSINYDSFSFD